MANAAGRSATGSFDYDILKSLQAIQGDVRAIFSVFRKDSTKQYEESRKALDKKIPKEKKDKFKLPKLPNFKSMFGKLGEGILDFGKLALAGAFLAGLLSEKFKESIDSWAPTSLLGKFIKALFTGDGDLDGIKERIKKALKSGLKGAGYGAMVGFVVGGIPGMVAGALIGAAIGMLVSWISTDTSLEKEKLKAAMRSKINMNAQKAGLAAGGIAGFLIGGPIGMIAGAMIGLAAGTLMKALTAETEFEQALVMAELKKGALFAGIGGIGGAILGSFFGPGGTIVGAFVGAILGLAINSAHEAVISQKLKSEKTKGLLPALEIILMNVFEFIGDMITKAMNGVIRLVNSILPDWVGKIDEFKVDTPEMNKAQRDQISARAKVREIKDQPDRATDGGVYKKLRGATEAEIKTVSDNTGWNLLDNIKNLYSGSTKGGPGDIETKSQKLIAMWNAQKRLSDAIDAEAKAKYIRDVGTPDVVDGMSELRRQQLEEESANGVERMFSQDNILVPGSEEANKVKAEKKEARLLEIQERKRNTYANAMQKKIDKAKSLELFNANEAIRIAKDKKIAPINNNLTVDLTNAKNIKRISDEVLARDTDRGMNTYGSGTTVIQDNSTMNNNGGGTPAPVFEHYGSFTKANRTRSLNLQNGDFGAMGS